jgi:hypothetical protein
MQWVEPCGAVRKRNDGNDDSDEFYLASSLVNCLAVWKKMMEGGFVSIRLGVVQAEGNDNDRRDELHQTSIVRSLSLPSGPIGGQKERRRVGVMWAVRQPGSSRKWRRCCCCCCCYCVTLGSRGKGIGWLAERILSVAMDAIGRARLESDVRLTI